MKLVTNLIVLPMIFCLIGCPMACSPVSSDDDDSAGDDDDSAEGDDDDSADETGDDDDSALASMGDARVFIERNCDDMRDNDRDEYTDCADPDCNQAPDCNGF